MNANKRRKTSARRREKGSGTLYKHGPYWVAKWRVAGKSFVRSTHETDRRKALVVLADLTAPFRAASEARRWEAVVARLEGARADAERLRAERDAVPLSALPGAWAKCPRRKDCGATTLRRYQEQLASFVRFVADRFPGVTSVRNVDSRIAGAYLQAVAKLSPNAYNKRIVLFRRVWKDLGSEAGIAENPWLDMGKRRLDTQSHRPLTKDEIDRVLATATGEMRSLIKIGLYSGLRLGDAATLDWSAVDTAAAVVRVVPRKTSRTSGAAVEIPLIPPLLQALAEALGSGEERGPVLPETCARYARDPSSVSDAVRRLFRSCGIETDAKAANGRIRPLVSFHSLRHTFVSICANAGVPLNVVQSVVGHATVKMTEYYAHASRDAVGREVARAFSRK